MQVPPESPSWQNERPHWRTGICGVNPSPRQEKLPCMAAQAVGDQRVWTVGEWTAVCGQAFDWWHQEQLCLESTLLCHHQYDRLHRGSAQSGSAVSYVLFDSGAHTHTMHACMCMYVIHTHLGGFDGFGRTPFFASNSPWKPGKWRLRRSLF